MEDGGDVSRLVWHQHRSRDGDSKQALETGVWVVWGTFRLVGFPLFVFHLLSFAGVQMLLPSVVEAGPVLPPLVPWSCDGEPMGRLSVGVPRRCLSGVLVVGCGMLGLGLGLLVLELPIPAWGGDAGAGRAGTKLGMLLPVLDRDAGSGAGTLWGYQYWSWGQSGCWRWYWKWDSDVGTRVVMLLLGPCCWY